MHIERVHIRLIDHPNPFKGLFALEAAYVEDYWMSAVGPSAVAILRYVARRAAAYADPGVTDDAAELGCVFGLGAGTGRWSPLLKTLDRLHHFGIAQWDIAPVDADTLAAISIYGRLDAVPLGYLRRWSAHRQAAHSAELAAHLRSVMRGTAGA
jgi:hypothetical protein